MYRFYHGNNGAPAEPWTLSSFLPLSISLNNAIFDVFFAFRSGHNIG